MWAKKSRGDMSGFKKQDSLVFPQRQAHVLLHLLQAVVVRVNEVKGQGARQRTAPSSWGDPQKPAGGSEVPISEGVKVTRRDVEGLLARSSL